MTYIIGSSPDGRRRWRALAACSVVVGVLQLLLGVYGLANDAVSLEPWFFVLPLLMSPLSFGIAWPALQHGRQGDRKENGG